MRDHKILLSSFLLFLSGMAAYSQSPLIAVEISPAQTAVNEGGDFLLSTVLRNTGNEALIMRHEACGYSDLWTVDNASIQVVPSSCDKPGFMGMSLKPGEDYKREVRIRAKLAPGVGESEWVTFRLGFKSEFKSDKDPAQPNPVTKTLWSNVVTVRVTRGSASSQ
jgi:hypothetical protein